MLASRRITALRPTKRDPDRASIHVNGRVVATLSYRHISELRIEEGQVWDEALAQRVAETALYEKAMKRAMNRLNRRAMSRRQLDRKLTELEFDEPTRKRVLDRLESLSLLDDEAYGRAVVREAMSRKPAGPRLLQQKLYQKGIDRKLADRLIAEAVEPDDQVGKAVELAQRKLRSLSRFDAVTRKRRLYGLLARRGFGPETIGDALDRLRKQIGGDEDE